MTGDNLPSIIEQVYFDGQLLTLADFQREQAFHIAWRDLQTSILCTPGILSGLGVQAGATASTVVIAAGLAVDTLGRIVGLIDRALVSGAAVTATGGSFTLDFNNPTYYRVGQTRTWRIWLEFGQQAVAGVQNQARQTPSLLLVEQVQETAPTAAIVLAEIVVTASSVTSQDQPPITTVGVQVQVDTSLAVASTLTPARLPKVAAAQLAGQLTSDQIASLTATKLTGALIVTPTGQVGIGVAAPTAQLEVAGAVTATGFIGSGAQLTDLQAAHIAGGLLASQITGTLSIEQLPLIPTTQLSGVLTVDQLPDLPAAKITGTLVPAQLPPIPAAQLSGVLTIDQLPAIPATQITGTLAPAQLPAIPAVQISGVLTVDQLPAIPAAQITGTLTPAQLPTLPATQIGGVLAVDQLPEIPAAQITGTLAPAQLPPIPAAQISGVLTVDQLPAIPAAQITGTLAPAQLPAIPAAQISGILTVDQLPAIPATQLTGTLAPAQLPILPATQIGGVLTIDQLPAVPATQITGTLAPAQLPAIPATQISGVLTVDQLPVIPASQLTGTIDPSLLPLIPPSRIGSPLRIDQIPLLASLLARVKMLEDMLRADPPTGLPAGGSYSCRPPHDQIAQRAYELYLARGQDSGHAEDDWFAAEHELLAKY